MMRWCRTRPLSRRIMYLFLIVLAMWSMTTFNIIVFGPRGDRDRRSSDVLRGEIIKLSEEYVQVLAKENGDVVDGPYVARYTGYDLKKTMAVLLDDMLTRLGRIEGSLGINNTNSLKRNTTLRNTSLTSTLQDISIAKTQFLTLKDVLGGKTEQCNLTDEERRKYPHCVSKMAWMKTMWKSHKCYAQFGVDGSMCSFLRYLSEVESYCPSQAWKRNPTETVPVEKNATIRTNMDDLLKLLVDPNDRHAYSFMRLRVMRMSDNWIAAINDLVRTQGMAGRTQRRVIIHLGLLTKQIGWKIAENQFSGGPLGELVQWTDLITCLYILGHNITITSEVDDIKFMLRHLPLVDSPCQNTHALPMDLFYTDIAGLTQIRKFLKMGYAKFKCLLRIVDSFGTQPAFNSLKYAKSKKIHTTWGGHTLDPRQFFTMFPHTPDNSFMGFVVEHHPQTTTEHIVRRNQALVYGKRDVFWRGKEKFVKLLSELVEVHSTVGKDGPALKFVPSFVTNHGILPGEGLQSLLRQSKIFIGLGYPYEGPAPLEAIANGAVFINPKFNRPHDRTNEKSLKGKPTFRQITSQHPYADRFIGKPFVHTIDIDNEREVRRTIAEIIASNEFPSYLPYEYTEQGMLQRMSAFIQRQDFCQFKKSSRQSERWPPPWSVQNLMAPLGVDCTDFCFGKGVICEPTYFPDINTPHYFTNNSIACHRHIAVEDIYVPGFNPKSSDCFLQADSTLFSCAGRNSTIRRICPCRTFAKGQTALCNGCTD